MDCISAVPLQKLLTVVVGHKVEEVDVDDDGKLPVLF